MIKNLIDRATFSAELHLSNKYRYCGTGTDLKGNIENLTDVLIYFNQYGRMIPLHRLVLTERGRCYNHLDYLCMEHDLWYYIAENHPDLTSKMKIEEKADNLLINRCEEWLEACPSKHEKRDTILVIRLITCKMRSDKCCNGCNLS